MEIRAKIENLRDKINPPVQPEITYNVPGALPTPIKRYPRADDGGYAPTYEGHYDVHAAVQKTTQLRGTPTLTAKDELNEVNLVSRALLEKVRAMKMQGKSDERYVFEERELVKIHPVIIKI